MGSMIPFLPKISKALLIKDGATIFYGKIADSLFEKPSMVGLR